MADPNRDPMGGPTNGPTGDDALVERLEAHLADESATPPPPGLTHLGISQVIAAKQAAQPGWWAGRRPALVALAGVAAVVLLVVGLAVAGDDGDELLVGDGTPTTVPVGDGTEGSGGTDTAGTGVDGGSEGTAAPGGDPTTTAGPGASAPTVPGGPEPTGVAPTVPGGGPIPTVPSGGGPPVSTPPSTGATTSTTAPTVPVSFRDDFADDPVGTTVPGGWQVLAGVWRVAEDSPGSSRHWAKSNAGAGTTSVMAPLGVELRDGTVAATVRTDGSAAVGLALRTADGRSECRLDRSSGSLLLVRWNGQAENLVDSRPAPLSSPSGFVDSRVELRVAGGAVTCSLAGGPSFTVPGATEATGTGVAVTARGNAALTDVEVTGTR